MDDCAGRWQPINEKRDGELSAAYVVEAHRTVRLEATYASVHEDDRDPRLGSVTKRDRNYVGLERLHDQHVDGLGDESLDRCRLLLGRENDGDGEISGEFDGALFGTDSNDGAEGHCGVADDAAEARSTSRTGLRDRRGRARFDHGIHSS